MQTEQQNMNNVQSYDNVKKQKYKQGKLKEGEWKISEENIDVMYDVLIGTQEKRRDGVERDEKIIAIFQHFCEHSTQDLSTISKYLQNIQPSSSHIKINQKYSKLYEQYLPAFIKSNKQYLRDNKSQKKQQIKANQNKNKLLANIQALLVKQNYQSQAMNPLLDTAIQTKQLQIWKYAQVTIFPSSSQNTNNEQTGLNVKAHQFYHQLLHKLLHIDTKTPQLYKNAALILKQAWNYHQSRNYIIQFMEACLKQNAKLDDEYEYQQRNYKGDSENNITLNLVWRLQSMMNNADQQYNAQFKQQDGISWCFVRNYYLENNRKYRKFRIIKQIESIKTDLDKQQLINIINKASPEQLVLLSTLNLPALISQQPPCSNIRYLQYLSSSQNKTKNYQKYLQHQLQIIKQSLINNSYPSDTVIVSAYKVITNVIWQGLRLEQISMKEKENNSIPVNMKENDNDKGNEGYRWRDQVKEAVKAVRHQLSKIIMNKQYHIGILLKGVLFQQTRLETLLTKLDTSENKTPALQLDEINLNRDSEQILSILTILKTANIKVPIKQLLSIMQYVLNLDLQQQQYQQRNQHKQVNGLVLIKIAEYVGTVYLQKWDQCVQVGQITENQQEQLRILLNIIQQIISLAINSQQHYLNSAIRNSHKFMTIILNLSILYNKLSLSISKSPVTSTSISQTINKYFLNIFNVLNSQQKLIAYLCDNTKCKQCRIYGNGNGNVENHYRSMSTVARLCLDIAMNFSQQGVLNENWEIMQNIKEMPYMDRIIGLNKIFKLITLTSVKFSSKTTHKYLQQIYSEHNTPLLKNLHKFNSTAIKYNQTIQHNPKYKQSVFESDMYRNHCFMYVYMAVFELYLQYLQNQESKEQQFKQEKEYVQNAICEFIGKTIHIIKKRMTIVLHNTAQFYSILNFFKFMVVISYHSSILTKLTLDPSTNIMTTLFQITHSSSVHPLTRQYISLIIAKLYTNCTQYMIMSTQNKINIKENSNMKDKIRETGQTYKQIMMDKINNQCNQVFNINVMVPVVFTLGYQMVKFTQIINKQQRNYSEQAIKYMENECELIFSAFIKYISCHHAYIRSIIQYYIKLKIQIQVQSEKQARKQIISEQNKEENNKQQSFLNYLCDSVWKNDKDCIKIMKNIGVAVEGFRNAMDSHQALEFLGYQRVEEYPTQPVLMQMRQDLKHILSSIYTINKSKLFIIKNTIQNKHLYNKIVKINKQIHKKITQLCNIKYIPQIYPLVLHYRLPRIIIIASLLQKVHNFGYIIRTLHSNPLYQSAILLIPSKQPLQHPQCKQFIPNNSQIQIIQIKQTEVQQFIKLNRSQGYPLIALEQCAGSVRVQQYCFPQKYMLLLGNQRIGAPATLLNMADVLVQIEQVGKVRSFNVHVSMVICLWQSLINNQGIK